jgi:hypothetical protein
LRRSLHETLHRPGRTRPREVAELLELAGRLDRHPEPQALVRQGARHAVLQPLAAHRGLVPGGDGRLGGSSFVITPGTGTWKLEARNGIVMDGEAAEHIREAVPVLASYADVLGIRAFAGGIDLEADLEERKFMEMAGICPVPLINLESAVNHPCQALADWKTMNDLGVPANGGRFVLSWANHPTRCRWRCRRRPCTWPRCAAWTSPCCGRTATRCRSRSWSARGPRPPLPAARCARPTTARRPCRART